MNTPPSAYRCQAGRPWSWACPARTIAATVHADHRIKGVSVTISALSQLIGAHQYSSTPQEARCLSTGDQAHHMAHPTPKGSKTAGNHPRQGLVEDAFTQGLVTVDTGGGGAVSHGLNPDSQ